MKSVNGIHAGLSQPELLAAVVRGLDMEILQLSPTEVSGVVQVLGHPNLRLLMVVGRFEVENDQWQLVEQDIAGQDFAQIVSQIGVSLRRSITIQPAGSFQCIGCLYISYEADNSDSHNTGTVQLYITEITLVS